MQTSPNTDFDLVERRIQTLTSILHAMKRRHPPTSRQREKEAPAFLRHLATLLTCGSKDDAEARRVIAVTGSLFDEELRTLVVTQNPSGSTDISELGVEEIMKSSGTFEQVVKGNKNAKLPQHIADVWAAIDSYDPNVKGQFRSFCLFIVRRCFRKLSKRVFQDKGCWDVSVSQKIFDWTPLSQELDDVRWIERPQWALVDFPPDVLDGLRERTIGIHGRPVTQWEFSNATLRSWAWLLAYILQQLEFTTSWTKLAREKGETDKETRGLNDIHNWCYCLHAYVHWKEGIVKTLLTRTSLAHAFDLPAPLNRRGDAEPEMRREPDESDGQQDELAEMRREPNESDGQQVLRHLQAIVAWHAAAQSLLDKNRRQIAPTLRVGLVEVTPRHPDLMTVEDFVKEFFLKRPASSSEARTSIENIIRKNYTMATFTGTTHAEATLMGLLKYFSPGSPSVNYGNQIEDATLRLLKEFIEPATFEKAIAVGKKCCWCCDRLGSLLDIDIKLPGSHGVLFAWTPPRVGVEVTILQQLEKELWDEMSAAVTDKISGGHSRQSSGSSTVFDENPLTLADQEKPGVYPPPPKTKDQTVEVGKNVKLLINWKSKDKKNHESDDAKPNLYHRVFCRV
ncbi:uncharacterized protein LACBIDRAFT_294726 [Laccaria bicolor S238N-H82]|uniref:Predicted protein n=1 Tax=Laccaria bicolor (strain S238N-H82 / ATCC MYA-4686) TaxID=486041 RepID=B0DHA5_LACBS|nr:uncharacterized protein LACBIDRAFT_294726 [Laccaria bicolor S238N-H82]EDR06078.1 predicted protein [Laccaria bicolor S238N-H82]|eukprot:XP_001883366.1 predicted protein [Laccaria bicolor S238N-H82]